MKKFSAIEKLRKILSLKSIMYFWYSHYKSMFFFGFLVVFWIGGFEWYQYLYRYQWSEARKQEFLEAHFKETAFRENKFTELVARIKERVMRHAETPFLTQDIFEGKKLSPPKPTSLRLESGETKPDEAGASVKASDAEPIKKPENPDQGAATE